MFGRVAHASYLRHLPLAGTAGTCRGRTISTSGRWHEMAHGGTTSPSKPSRTATACPCTWCALTRVTSTF
eukprot:1072462-Prorocentrum_minimum.AAC.1